MSYIDEIASEIYWKADPNPQPLGWFEDRVLYRAYAVLLLAKGDVVTNEDVHNAWAAWASEDNDTHPSLVPFDRLEPHIQQLDEPYTKAICEIAALRQRGRAAD